MLLTKIKVVGPSQNFFKYFAKNGKQSNIVLVLVLVLDSKVHIDSHSDNVSAEDSNCDSDNLRGRGNDSDRISDSDGYSDGDRDFDQGRDNCYIDNGGWSGSGIDTDNKSQSDNDSNGNSDVATQRKRNLIKEFLLLFSLQDSLAATQNLIH